MSDLLADAGSYETGATIVFALAAATWPVRLLVMYARRALDAAGF